MIQVDVFWSFAMGAAFAAMAGENLKKTDSMFVNKYFVYTVAFLSMIFAPSGVYLLWHYPGWETMFFLDRDLHGIWPCLFANTNVSLGVLGFCICYQLIKKNDDLGVHKYWTTAYSLMFAILTFGYDRFLYAGTKQEFDAGVKYSIVEFFSCEVFHTLLVMAIFVMPPIFYAMIKWPSEYRITNKKKTVMIDTAARSYLRISAIIIIIYSILYFANQLPEHWGHDRAIAFILGQCVFGSLIFIPLMLIPVSSKQKR